jgi:hypothetical protein
MKSTEHSIISRDCNNLQQQQQQRLFLTLFLSSQANLFSTSSSSLNDKEEVEEKIEEGNQQQENQFTKQLQNFLSISFTHFSYEEFQQILGPCQYLIPSPNYVVKTKRKSDNLKIFINVCSHSSIAMRPTHSNNNQNHSYLDDELDELSTALLSSNSSSSSSFLLSKKYQFYLIPFVLNYPCESYLEKDQCYCMIVDVCLHPYELDIASQSSPPYSEVIIIIINIILFYDYLLNYFFLYFFVTIFFFI